MKFFLFLLLPICASAQKSSAYFANGLTAKVSETITSGEYTSIICSRTHIDTIKNVEWYVETRADTGILSVPMSIICNSCTFLHTWNDLSKENHWYALYHGKEDSWAYYIHEVRLICLKQKNKSVLYPH